MGPVYTIGINPDLIRNGVMKRSALLTEPWFYSAEISVKAYSINNIEVFYRILIL